jgi:DNA-binding NarL/FixJ family response regulator
MCELLLPQLPAIGVLLADAHGPMRRALRRVLETDEGIEVVGESADLTATFAGLARLAAGVLVVDTGLLGGDPGATIALLHDRARGLRIILTTMEAEPSFVARAGELGADALVVKQRAGSDLLPAIRGSPR